MRWASARVIRAPPPSRSACHDADPLLKKRLALVALCLLLSGLQYRLWVGDGGVFETRHLQQTVYQQSQANTQLQLRNSVLQAEVADLRNSGAAIEAHARSELGMIRKGEAFYLVVGSDSPAPGSPAPSSRAPGSRPPGSQ